MQVLLLLLLIFIISNINIVTTTTTIIIIIIIIVIITSTKQVMFSSWLCISFACLFCFCLYQQDLSKSYGHDLASLLCNSCQFFFP